MSMHAPASPPPGWPLSGVIHLKLLKGLKSNHSRQWRKAGRSSLNACVSGARAGAHQSPSASSETGYRHITATHT